MGNGTSTYDSILECTRALIVTGGYNGFSYADIANAVGIRKASIHHHFPTKADLVRTMVAQYRMEAETGLANLAAVHPDPVDQLRAYTGYWAACIGDQTRPFCICALLATEMPALPAEIGTEVTAYFRILSRWLISLFEQAAERGDIALTGPASIEADMFMATVHGAMLSARAFGDPALFGMIVEPLLERLFTAA